MIYDAVNYWLGSGWGSWAVKNCNYHWLTNPSGNHASEDLSPTVEINQSFCKGSYTDFSIDLF